MVASTAPFLGLIISLIGALCISVLAIIFPAIVDLCVNWDEEKGGVLLIIKDLMLVLFGLFGLLSGTYASLYGIIFKLQNDNDNIKQRLVEIFV